MSFIEWFLFILALIAAVSIYGAFVYFVLKDDHQDEHEDFDNRSG